MKNLFEQTRTFVDAVEVVDGEWKARIEISLADDENGNFFPMLYVESWWYAAVSMARDYTKEQFERTIENSSIFDLTCDELHVPDNNLFNFACYEALSLAEGIKVIQ
jgi:hypothetical protein